MLLRVLKFAKRRFIWLVSENMEVNFCQTMADSNAILAPYLSILMLENMRLEQAHLMDLFAKPYNFLFKTTVVKSDTNCKFEIFLTLNH